MNMGGQYEKQNQLDSAYYFAQKTMEYCELNHFPPMQAFGYSMFKFSHQNRRINRRWC